MRGKEGYLTVYLALCLTVILSLYLALIDSARRNGAGLEALCAAEAGMQSVMAEYHRELSRQYNLFAVDSSYGTKSSGRGRTGEHLAEYVRRNLDCGDVLLGGYLYRDFFGLCLESAEVSGVSLMTDGNGAVFRRRAIEAVRDDVGLHLLEELKGWMQSVRVNGLDAPDTETERRELEKELEGYNGREIETLDGESVQVEIQNPAEALEEVSRQGILRLTVADCESLSAAVINSGGLIQSRMAQGKNSLGNLETTQADSLTDRFFFQEYLLRYMGSYGDEREEDVLKYQIEYLIAGNDSDVDNLRSVVGRICAIREAANALYLLSSSEKRLEIQGAALVACGLLLLPWLIPVLEAAILLGWAFAESVYDVKSLLSGGCIPLLKDDDSWHYGLETALKGDLGEATAEGQGLSYRDYLRILMFLTDLDVLTARAMNMVEADIRLTPGNGDFRLDACCDRLEMQVEISSSFGYAFRIQRERSY